MLLRHIRYFLAVAEHRHFTRAATALHVSQPALSQQIKQLEALLGVQLFDRSGKSVRLTDAGEAWMVHAKLGLQHIHAGARAIQEVGTLHRGVLRCAAPPTLTPYLMGPLIARFHALHPEVTVNFLEIAQEEIEAMLTDDELDLGIVFSPLQRTDLDYTPLYEEKLGFVAGASHRLAARSAPLPPAAFAAEPLVLLNRSFATRQHIDAYCARHGIVAQVAVEVNAVGALLEIVRQGTLGTVLPTPISAVHQELRAVPLMPSMQSRQVVYARRKGAYRSAASNALVDVLNGLMRDIRHTHQ
ncbi:transcriptional regulator CynR [Massilia sp. S19_KUP03_FR1]|uniref:transcriptional regulator CynR n=1 Tax=Massilia sp. S19_KUP03_FR1 TaxID=3025503 RepID=UPI002FCDCB36